MFSILNTAHVHIIISQLPTLPLYCVQYFYYVVQDFLNKTCFRNAPSVLKEQLWMVVLSLIRVYLPALFMSSTILFSTWLPLMICSVVFESIEACNFDFSACFLLTFFRRVSQICQGYNKAQKISSIGVMYHLTMPTESKTLLSVDFYHSEGLSP